MKVKEIRQKSREELTKNIPEHVEALRVFRFNISGSKTKNVREGRNLRRNAARISTILKEKQNHA